MDIHAPHEPVLTLKQAAVHLAIVTVGILIALSFEGILEWRHHRSLVSEARANIRTELENNRRDVERLIGEMDGMKARLERGIDALDARTTSGPSAAQALFGTVNGSVLTGYDLSELSSASRTTADMTGAFALMDYVEVKRYAAAYNRQELYSRIQDQAFSNAIAAFSLGQHLDIGRASAVEIDDIKKQLRLAIGDLMIERQVAVALTKAYGRALAGETK